MPQVLRTSARRTLHNSSLVSVRVTLIVHLGAAASTRANALVPSSLRQEMEVAVLAMLNLMTLLRRSFGAKGMLRRSCCMGIEE